MKKIIFLFLLLVPFLTSSQTAEDYYNKGDESLQKNDYSGAINYFNKAIELNPDYASAYFARGSCYNLLQKNDEAIKDLSKAIKLESDFFSAYYMRGCAYSDMKKYDEAIKDFNKAIELNSGSAEYYFDRGNAYYRSTKYDEALKDFNKTIELKPEADAFFNRGLTKIMLGKTDDGCADLKKAQSMGFNADLVKANMDTYCSGNNPQTADVYFNKGNDAFEKKDYSGAITCYSKAIELKPDFADAFFNRGYIYYTIQKYDESINDYSKVIELSPKYASAYLNRGVDKIMLGNMEEGCKDLKKAQELGSNPDSFKEYLEKYCK